MYRPKDWKNPYLYFGTPHTEFDLASNEHREIYEAGADAMLEGLIKQPSDRGANVLYVDIEADSSTILHEPHRRGWLVFIPDEEEKNNG